MGDVEVGKECIRLETHGGIAFFRRHLIDIFAADENLPFIGNMKPPINFNSEVLPQPLGPSKVTNSPSSAVNVMLFAA